MGRRRKKLEKSDFLVWCGWQSPLFLESACCVLEQFAVVALFGLFMLCVCVCVQDIEALLQGKEDSGDFADGAAPHSALAQELYGILYATTGDFVAVAANGEVEAPVESAN